MEVVLSSANPDKVRELNEMISGHNVKFVLPKGDFNPDETGSDFEENAYIKALEAAEVSDGEYFMADDSGLCVDFLDGAPGIKSARYAPTPEGRIERVLKELEGVENDKRSAKFVCALVLCNKKGEILFKIKGECKGRIGYECKGTNGFGYDPIFLPEGLMGKTMAQLPPDIKNTISHRGIALNKMLEYLENHHG